MDPSTTPATTASHLEYKLLSCAKSSSRSRDAMHVNRDENDEEDYHCTVNSIASGSSNHTELLRAYDFGKRFIAGGETVTVSDKRPFYQQHHHHLHHLQEGEIEVYGEKSNLSEVSETPTDPGIRRFTKSPPRPNETRTAAVCFSIDTTVTHNDTTEDEDEEEDELPDVQDDESEDDDDSESVLTASPAVSTYSEQELSSPSTPTNDQQPAGTFSAIPRTRSRHPSWAQHQLQRQPTSRGVVATGHAREITQQQRSRREQQQQQQQQKQRSFISTVLHEAGGGNFSSDNDSIDRRMQRKSRDGQGGGNRIKSRGGRSRDMPSGGTPSSSSDMRRNIFAASSSKTATGFLPTSSSLFEPTSQPSSSSSSFTPRKLSVVSLDAYFLCLSCLAATVSVSSIVFLCFVCFLPQFLSHLRENRIMH